MFEALLKVLLGEIERLNKLYSHLQSHHERLQEKHKNRGLEIERQAAKIRELKAKLKSSDFRQHLESTSDKVRTWPEWKRNMLGPALPEDFQKFGNEHAPVSPEDLEARGIVRKV